MEHQGFQYKTVQHFEYRRDVHFLTFSCAARKPLLESDTLKLLLADSVSRAMIRHSFDLLAFVFMPEHVHLLVLPTAEEPSISKLLWGIKRPMAFRAKRMLNTTSPTDRFHFWQAGPGFDSNLRSWESVIAAANYIHLNPVRRGLVARPDDYRWSSARQWMTPDAPPDSAVPPITRSR